MEIKKILVIACFVTNLFSLDNNNNIEQISLKEIEGKNVVKIIKEEELNKFVKPQKKEEIKKRKSAIKVQKKEINIKQLSFIDGLKYLKKEIQKNKSREYLLKIANLVIKKAKQDKNIDTLFLEEDIMKLDVNLIDKILKEFK